jgi:thymidylate synthase
MYVFQNLNRALIGLSRELLANGVARKTRGFDCIEIPNPVLICIKNPTDRYINIPERKWNKVFGFVESLWIASGTNHMGLVAGYVDNMKNFSDDGQFMRAAYGPRIRAFSGLATDYAIEDPNHRNITSGVVQTVDQLRYVIESFKRDPDTRQATISLHDPVKDDFDSNGNLKVTKDTPCCRTLQFMVVDGKLDCTLTIRSNDLIWGFSAVNAFNFMFMQEYIAGILGLKVGNYYHFAVNLHFYSDKLELVDTLARLNPDDYESEFGRWEYSKFSNKVTLEQFDNDILNLFDYEKHLRTFREDKKINFHSTIVQDWANVFLNRWVGKENKTQFYNPYLNKLFKIKEESSWL